MRMCMNAVYIYRVCVTIYMMANCLKSCFPFGFNKYMVPRDKNVFLCTPSPLPMTERKDADIHTYTQEGIAFFFLSFSEVLPSFLP